MPHGEPDKLFTDGEPYERLMGCWSRVVAESSWAGSTLRRLLDGSRLGLSGWYFTTSEARTMADRVASHYSENLELAGVIANHLRSAGKDFPKLTTTDLATVDEFHIRGRKATLELAEKMNLDANSHVLDIGSGLGGPARTLAETYGCHVTGIDLTQAFCDAAMTIHVAMNIAAKDKMYMEAHRVIKPNGIFAVYDVLQGEGGEVLYPVPWAREPSISHLVTPDDMKSLLVGAGFKLLEVQDSTEDSQAFFALAKT